MIEHENPRAAISPRSEQINPTLKSTELRFYLLTLWYCLCLYDECGKNADYNTDNKILRTVFSPKMCNVSGKHRSLQGP